MKQTKGVLRLLSLLLVGSILPACGGSSGGPGLPSSMIRSFDPAPLADTQPPTVTVAVATSVLQPANGKMVDVGLSVIATDDSGISDITIRVFSNESDPPGDDASPASLFRLHQLPLLLRAKRGGRVYLIVARALDAAGNVGFAGTTVVVPKGGSAQALQTVETLAAQALAGLTANGSPVTPFPAGSFLNAAPVALNDSYARGPDPLHVAAPGVLGNDVDADVDPLTAVLAAGPANGTLVLQPDGSFTYTPNAGFTGTDSFIYLADDGWTTSAPATVTLTAPAAQNTITTVTTSDGTTVFGEPVTFTATVTPVSPGSIPTGTVTFFETTNGTTLGSVALNASGMATLTSSALPAGLLAIQANYLGNADFNPSSGTVSQFVALGLTQTSLIGIPNPSTFGDPVTFTATVTPLAPSTGTPTGIVTFVDNTGGVLLGTTSLGPTGQAVLTTNTLSSGVRIIQATYTPGAGSGYAASAGTHVQTVQSWPTSILFTASPAPSLLGQPVTLTVTVSAIGSPLIPTGTVTFSFSDPSTGTTIVLGTVGLDASGVATLVTDILPLGILTLGATYSGADGFNSISVLRLHVVN
jgi:hypothetical protein